MSSNDPPPQLPPHHLFHHEAMMTTYSIRICTDDDALARSLACECFHRIDELEEKLSRYFEGGDVYCINHMAAGETLHISEECHQCLLVAMEAAVHTCGLFDPTLGTMIAHRKSGLAGELPQAIGQLTVHPDTPAVTCDAPGRVIDLGGIGKGYTLDQLKETLTGWDIDGALISAGASTHLAIGQASWPIDLSGDNDTLRINLHDEALSASGTAIQGSHIVHPDPSREHQEHQPTRIWSRSPSAAHSDAWSTALMLMAPEEMAAAPCHDAMLHAIHIERDDGFHTLTPLPTKD
ncbi:MAG: FAD:protein FMN transferase [Verrucomicrobiae bacterium]|nr:FAD:protein FMN transferase [Verrucomicrobiae bacterium]NNJ42618.1 FAD:protein FMN transferase [Akkermansiaceae bacterium]